MIDNITFKKILSVMLPLVHKEGAPGLSDILFDFISDKKINIVASDSRKTCIITVETQHSCQIGNSFLISLEDVKTLIKNLPEGDVFIYSFEGKLYFGPIGFEPKKDQYPDYSRIMKLKRQINNQKYEFSSENLSFISGILYEFLPHKSGTIDILDGADKTVFVIQIKPLQNYISSVTCGFMPNV